MTEQSRFMSGICAIITGFGIVMCQALSFYECAGESGSNMCAPGYQARILPWTPGALIVAAWGIYSWIRYFRWLRND